jgi:putative FmdB family regulatory protein
VALPVCHHRGVPTYEYQCRDCGAVIEVIHAMREDGPSTCASCGGALRRVLYPAGIIFKGSGFYRTDSRAERSSGAASSAKAPDAAPTDGGGSSTPAPSASGGAADSGSATSPGTTGSGGSTSSSDGGA